MKIWNGYVSEHSMNLVMIGHFQGVDEAEEAKRLIDRIAEQVAEEPEFYQGDLAPRERFSEKMLELLMAANLHILGSEEIEQFSYDVHITAEGQKVVVTTDEVDISAYLKVLIDRGARVEVYSAHQHRGTGYGRGT